MREFLHALVSIEEIFLFMMENQMKTFRQTSVQNMLMSEPNFDFRKMFCGYIPLIAQVFNKKKK